MAAREKPLVAWSHSAVELFRTCPNKYYEEKITKAWVEEFKGPAAEYGVKVHKAWELRVRYGTPFPDGIATPAELVKWEALAKRLEDMEASVRTELQLCLNNNYEVVDWFAKDAWVRTILDFMALKGETAMVLDYKTGREKDDDRQLALMAAVVFKYHPEVHKVVAGYVWLKDGLKLHTVTFVRQHMGKLWSQYLPYVTDIERAIKTGHWPKKRSGLCQNYCPVLDCEFNGRFNG